MLLVKPITIIPSASFYVAGHECKKHLYFIFTLPLDYLNNPRAYISEERKGGEL